MIALIVLGITVMTMSVFAVTALILFVAAVVFDIVTKHMK